MKKVFVGEGVSSVTFHDGVEHMVEAAERAFTLVEDKLAEEIEKRFPGHFAFEEVLEKSESEPTEPNAGSEAPENPVEEPKVEGAEKPADEEAEAQPTPHFGEPEAEK